MVSFVPRRRGEILHLAMPKSAAMVLMVNGLNDFDARNSPQGDAGDGLTAAPGLDSSPQRRFQ